MGRNGALRPRDWSRVEFDRFIARMYLDPVSEGKSIVWATPRRVRAATLAIGRCASCGYPVSGLKREGDDCLICPECGAAWAAADVATSREPITKPLKRAPRSRGRLWPALRILVPDDRGEPVERFISLFVRMRQRANLDQSPAGAPLPPLELQYRDYSPVRAMAVLAASGVLAAYALLRLLLWRSPPMPAFAASLLIVGAGLACFARMRGPRHSGSRPITAGSRQAAARPAAGRSRLPSRRRTDAHCVRDAARHGRRLPSHRMKTGASRRSRGPVGLAWRVEIPAKTTRPGQSGLPLIDCSRGAPKHSA
jgi:hypothetical protein